MSTQDPNIRTSRVFDATLAVFDRLCEASFPAHPITGDEPKVYLFRDPGTEAAEYVSVLLTEDPAENEWAYASSATSIETFFIDVLVRTQVPGETSQNEGEAERKVVRRLEAIADVVQLIAYDVNSGKPLALLFDNEQKTGRATSVSFALAHTDDGFIGDATVRFQLAARI